MGGELAPSTFDSTGGGFAFDPGGRGAPGGNVDIVTTGALSFGASFAAPADAPAPPAHAQRIASLDADVSVTGTALIDGNVAASGPRRLTVMGGDLFIAGKLRADSDLTLEAPNGSIYVTGTIDTSGTTPGQGRRHPHQPMATCRCSAPSRVEVAWRRPPQRGDRRGRGCNRPDRRPARRLRAAPARRRRPGRWRRGTRDDRRRRPPASAVIALDVSAGGGDVHDGAGAGGSFTLVAGETSPSPERCAPGAVRSLRAATATVASPAISTMDINTIVGNQSYRPGSVIMLDGGGSGGVGTAGGGGHLYGRSYDGVVTMSGSLFARGGKARDAGIGGMGGHVNLFSDSNYDGVGGDLTITPEGVIDVSGGAGSTGGSARNDGTADVAVFPEGQEMIAVLLNADGIHGTPMNGVIDNQGVLIARGGEVGGAGGDIAFHGEGTGGLHDPLGGQLEMGGNGAPDGQFLSE